MALQPICRLLLLIGITATFSICSLDAAEPAVILAEKRTFDVFVDGKPSGQSILNVTRYDDGADVVQTEAKIKVVWTVFSYVYEFHGEEQWRKGQLEKLTSRAVDGGRKLSLDVTRSGNGYSVTKPGGRTVATPEFLLTTNYWLQPPIDANTRQIAVLDADNGKLYDVRIESLGEKPFTVAGQSIAARAYRLSGQLDVEFWFDAQGLLVWQNGKEDGHPTELKLASVQSMTLPRPGKER